MTTAAVVATSTPRSATVAVTADTGSVADCVADAAAVAVASASHPAARRTNARARLICSSASASQPPAASSATLASCPLRRQGTAAARSNGAFALGATSVDWGGVASNLICREADSSPGLRLWIGAMHLSSSRRLCPSSFSGVAMRSPARGAAISRVCDRAPCAGGRQGENTGPTCQRGTCYLQSSPKQQNNRAPARWAC